MYALYIYIYTLSFVRRTLWQFTNEPPATCAAGVACKRAKIKMIFYFWENESKKKKVTNTKKYK